MEDEEDTKMLQNSLNKFYIWADGNNMSFNSSKFEIKITSTNISYDDAIIDSKEQVRDLGIMMGDTATSSLVYI